MLVYFLSICNMGMKPKSTILLTAMAMMLEGGTTRTAWRQELIETEDERKLRLFKAEQGRYKKQGLTLFVYGENSLWALNRKSADRKAFKRGWISEILND